MFSSSIKQQQSDIEAVRFDKTVVLRFYWDKPEKKSLIECINKM